MWAPFARARRRARAGRVRPARAPGSRSARALPLRMSGLARVVTRAAGRARARARRRARLLVRRRRWRRSSRTARPSACGGSCCARPRPAWAAVPPRPMAALMLATPGALLPPAAARAERRRTSPAGAPRASPACSPPAPAARLAHPPGPARLRLPALRGRRLVEPAVAAPRHAADARRGGRRRPERPGPQRAACSPRACPTRGCTSSTAAGTCSCSTSPRTRRRAIRAFLDEADGPVVIALTTTGRERGVRRG